MKSVNRYVAIIKPRQPYVDWVNSLPDAPQPLTLGDFQQDCTAILIPEFDDPEESLRFIGTMAEVIFEEELAGWTSDESAWPVRRTEELFWEWFEVEVHSEVFDSAKGPIKKEAV